MNSLTTLLSAAALVMFLWTCTEGTAHGSENDVSVVAGSETDSTLFIDKPYLKYAWLDSPGRDSVNNLFRSIPSPKDYHRVSTDSGSFSEWLRYLPVHPSGKEVLLFNGKLKNRQDVHAAVINIDPGKSDLQQCADATMRLRGEYLFSTGKYGEIHFNYTSGDKCDYTEWSNGIRLQVNGNKVKRVSGAGRSEITSHSNFRGFMNNVFMFAGTLSLAKEMTAVSTDSMQIGDVFIQGGSPGHAVIVVDMCVNERGEKLFLLAQSYMPAQEIHVLKNLNEPSISPWYRIDESGILNTPEWEFRTSDLKRF